MRGFDPRRLRDFIRNPSGAGAVEFAMIVPVLLILLLGGSELGVALTVDRKVKAAAGAAVDLASQSTSLKDSDFHALMGIARGMIAPYSLGSLDMRITQIAINDKGESTVDWSCPTNGYAKLAKGEPVSIPPEFQPMTQSLLSALLSSSARTIYIVRGETKYSFAPVTGEVLTGPILLSGLSFVQPRYSDSVQSETDGCAAFALQ